MKNLFLFLTFISTLSFGQTITSVTPENFTGPLNNIYFALPNTVVEAKINTKKKLKKAPIDNVELEKIFSSNFINILPNRLTGKAEYSIEKVSAQSKAVVDTKNLYRISTDRKFNKKNTIGISVSENGLITGASIESKDLTVKFVTTVISFAAVILVNMKDEDYNPAVHGPIIFNRLDLSDIISNPTNENGKKMIKIIKKKESFKDSLSFYNKQLNKILSGVLKRNFYPGGVEKTEFRVKKLEEKTTYWKGEVEKKKQEFIAVLNNIMGTIEESEVARTFKLPWTFPFTENQEKEVVKQIRNNVNNQELEIIDYPTPLTFDKCKSCIKFILEKENLAIGNILNANITNSNKKGLPFKIPEAYRLVIKSKDKILGEYPFKAAGKLGRLSSQINISNVEYYEQLGWIKSFKASNKSIETADIDSLGGSISGLRNKIQGKTELELITEEATLLEMQLKKLKTEAELKSLLNPAIIEEVEDEN
ncbi:hypothetical protein [Maribacter sp. 2308TA10-17]|uniref:hypothetical protein n=1 Tax=Maribacter sp. 2308TA10-17 TaxID=3386276 RepID=UPI0039BC2BEA